MHKGGYAVTCNTTQFARTTFNQDFVRNELENHDGYVLIVDRSMKPETLIGARAELNRVRSLGFPVFIYHNFPENSSFEWKEKLDLSNDEVVRLQSYKDATTLASDTVSALSHYLGPDTSLGWIRSSTFQTINQSIEKINQTRALLDTSEHLIDAFIENCNVEGLRQAFENCGIVAEKSKYGEQSWFISKDNPVQRFFPQDELLSDSELPVLFEKLPNRFEILFEDKDRLILFDHYLNLKWWTLGLKKTSFEEAVSYAIVCLDLLLQCYTISACRRIRVIFSSRGG